MQSKFKTAIFAQKAFAKVVHNKKLNTLRLLVSFDGHSNITQRNAQYASGDLCSVADNAQYVQHSIDKAMQNAQQVLRTNNIVIVN